MVTKENPSPISVTLLHLPDCPLVDQVRSTLRDCLTRSGASVVVEQLAGPYPSPTLLIDGADVTGKSLVQQPSCRLDLLTGEQIMAALARASSSSASTAETVERP
jgi:hypothetical protein